MKIQNILIMLLLACCMIFSACEDKDYPAGIPELEHHYYIVYVPNNNSEVSVNRDETDLLKLPVQFYSSFTRSYDAVAHYTLLTTGIADPAVLGEDFEIVDANGNNVSASDGKYAITFPRAIQATDTIYIKMLNNPLPGSRSVQINLEDNITNDFRVDIFSTAFRRTLVIN